MNFKSICYDDSWEMAKAMTRFPSSHHQQPQNDAFPQRETKPAANSHCFCVAKFN
jgi:hypothetical protein